ncbi:MAG: hypothetical protein RLZZ184_1924 [Cyanobacteriota bacterium]|jgi:hypothetical protein
MTGDTISFALFGWFVICLVSYGFNISFDFGGGICSLHLLTLLTRYDKGTGNREQGTGDKCYATVTGDREQVLRHGDREQVTGNR